MLIIFCMIVPALALPWQYFIGERPTASEWQTTAATIHPTRYAVPIQHTPILPFMPWGLRFDQDVVISINTNKPSELAMIEVAQLQLSDGELWFVLESDRDGQQRVLVDAALPVDLFPAPIHRSELSVRQQPVGDRVRTKVRYQRLNGQEMAFEVLANPQTKPLSQSNGHAMNHSQASTLAVLKLDSRQPAKLTWSGATLPVQRILGVPVTAMIAQRVIGVRSGSWRQHYGRVGEQELHPVAARAVQLGHDPALQAHYVKLQEQFQLTHFSIVQSRTDGSSATLGELEFLQPLPDLRYGVPLRDFETTFQVRIDHQVHAHGRIFVEPIDEHHLWVKLVPHSPSWAAERPVWTLLRYRDGGVDTHSWLLTPGSIPQHEFQTAAPEPVSELLSWAGCRWLKTPHRVSRLLLSSDGVELGGGTWANGTRAADQPQCRWLTHKASGVAVVRTPPMVLKPNGAGEVVARAKLKVPVELGAQERIIPFIYGLEFAAGEGFEETGITVAGWTAEIEQIQPSDDGVHIDVALRQSVGSVPDRWQKVNRYTAVGSIKVGLLRAELGSDLSRKEHSQQAFEPAYRSHRRLEPLACPLEIKPTLLQKWSLRVLDQGQHSGRYIRGFQWSGSTSARDSLFMEAAWSRPTPFELKRAVIQGTELSERLTDARCHGD